MKKTLYIVILSYILVSCSGEGRVDNSISDEFVTTNIESSISSDSTEGIAEDEGEISKTEVHSKINFNQ